MLGIIEAFLSVWSEDLLHLRIVNPLAYYESALYRLEGGWIGDFYESLQNMGVLKTNDKIKPITMQRKVDYTRQTIVKYSMKWKHKD